jgi:Heparinase II/III-like protein/Alginate lyase
VLSAAELKARKEELKESPDLRQLLERLAARAEPVLTRMPTVPAEKALLSTDGGFCPDDRVGLEFDPWSPQEHRCPRCGRIFSGNRHDRAWARFQHLWLAERSAHLATLAAMDGRDDAAARACEILGCYAERYQEYPNRDNVLGPSHLFFSTYLESIWLTNYVAAAALLRESGRLEQELAEAVGGVVDEAANVIGEFDEGLSNRQTWHNAALAAAAVWFEDEELATRAVESATGIIAHLLRGFGDDGMWFEGENYHLFALRGELLAMSWARQAGVDLLADPKLAERLRAALRAPALTALPDHTFPARKDSRFGVSLAQPMYLELWEIGLGRLAGEVDLTGWLRELYATPAPAAERFDSYLHEAGEPALTRPRSRADLSWWSLLEMAPSLPEDAPAWNPGNTLLESQGLPILRTGARYTSVECGAYGGGHGHPDRLHLTLHADGRHWLADPGTGSYVTRDLLWYRSTLAHNAPRLDGLSQPVADATCDAFDTQGDWGWARGSFGQLTRTLVAGPGYLLDVVELSAPEEHLLELPWHLEGQVEVLTQGSWASGTLEDEFVSNVERFVPTAPGPLLLRSRAGDDGPALHLHLLFPGELFRAQAPGRPRTGSSGRASFFLARARGRNLRLIATLEPSASPRVQELQLSGEVIQVTGLEGVDHHAPNADGWDVTLPEGRVRLRGRRQMAAPLRPLVDLNRPVPVGGVALHSSEPPSLDGSLEGFDDQQALLLDHEDQYRRSEEPFPGPEEFSATVLANWDADALYLGLEVVKQEIVTRDEKAPALHLDNEPDDIHADGVQLYLRPSADAPAYGFLVALASETGAIRVRPTGGAAGTLDMVQGSWQRTESGYTLSLAVAIPEWRPRTGDTIDFDVVVNRAVPDRQRRAGQLVWSGGGGWVYLRGDRQDPTRFGRLELA